jgi:hypothetical protein
MKKLLSRLVLLAFFILMLSPIDINASSNGGRYNKDHYRKCNSVNAPIEGGLIALLIGGGIAFFGIKKKKANKN